MGKKWCKGRMGATTKDFKRFQMQKTNWHLTGKCCCCCNWRCNEKWKWRRQLITATNLLRTGRSSDHDWHWLYDYRLQIIKRCADPHCRIKLRNTAQNWSNTMFNDDEDLRKWDCSASLRKSFVRGGNLNKRTPYKNGHWQSINPQLCRPNNNPDDK